MFGPDSKRALLEIAEVEQGKNNVRKPILCEGQRDGTVEVLSIDIVNNKVRIRNSDIETELTFEKLKTPSAAPTPGGAPPPVPSPLNHPAGIAAPIPIPAPASHHSSFPKIQAMNRATAAWSSWAATNPRQHQLTLPASTSGGGTSYAAAGTTSAGNNSGLNLANLTRTVRNRNARRASRASRASRVGRE